MIRGLKSLGNIHGPEDACEAAGRLDILAGGTKGADLVFTGLLEAGESTAVYLFRQQFEGAEGLTEDRVLKIAVNAAGQPEAVFSSLSPAPPEFPEGDLSPITGEDQDPEESEAAAQRVVYPPEQTFDYMERQQWTGTVTGVDGAKQALTVPVMRDMRTGVWYLGDPERKIAVGDFASLAYGEEQLQLIHRDRNEGWNDEDLITYANVIRVWDFYAAMGWTGPDGHGTPLLLLRNMCEENGEPIFNAAYLGQGDGWQCFAWGEDTYLGQGLDVIAHEYTHCVTETAMGANLYMDDYGAINEAISDILGNLCEAVCANEKSSEWLVGEDAGLVMRDMLDPHAFGQPEYVWDLYYAPNAWTPGDANDMGGVHANSSILNRVAARLCEEYGMSLTDAMNFWISAVCGMTPRTNYFRMPALLEWALETSGNGAFRQALQNCVEDGRMAASAREPETLPDGTRLVRLTLPETEEADSLMLVALQLDSGEILTRLEAVGGFLQTVWNAVRSGSGAGLTQAWKDVLSKLNMEGLTDALLSGDPEQVKDAALGSLMGLLSEHSTWRQADGRTASMVVQNLPTIYLLMDARELMDSSLGMDPESNPDMNSDGNSGTETEAAGFGGLAVLAGDRWIGLDSLMSVLPFAEEETQSLSDEQAARIEALIEPLGKLAINLVEDLLAGPQAGNSRITELPTAGLEFLGTAAVNPAA